MGIFIIILVFISEVTFTIYCIKTKDNQNKVKSWVRIATFMELASNGYAVCSIDQV